MNQYQHFKTLLQAVHTFYQRDAVHFPMLQQLNADFAALIDTPFALPAPRPLPVLRHLEAIAKQPTHADVAPIVEALCPIANDLYWLQNPNYAAFGTHYLDNYGFTVFVGPNGVIPHDKILISVGIWADVLYPMHHHEPEELYHVLTGTPEFCVDDQAFVPKVSGDAIFHQSWQPHAQQFSGPALLMACWYGDVQAYAVLVE